MREYIALKPGDRNLLIKKAHISRIEHWEDDKGIHRIIIYMAFEDKGIPVPVDQSQGVLEEMKEYWEQ